MPYVVDYTIQKDQAQSILCNLADELLLKIGSHVFAHCQLEYWSQADNASIGYDSVVRIPSRGATEGLNFLRTCKLLRGKLLPNYIKDATLGVFSSLRQYDGYASSVYVTIQPLVHRMLPFVNLPATTLGDIKKLELSAAAHHIIDPRLFPNLEEIVLHMRHSVSVTVAEAQSDARLLEACREQAKIPSTELLANLAGVPDIPRSMCADWIRELMDMLSGNPATANVKVIMKHRVSTNGFSKYGFYGAVIHDLTNDRLVSKIKGPKDEDHWHKIMGEPRMARHDQISDSSFKIVPTYNDGRDRFDPAAASPFLQAWLEDQFENPTI